MPTLPKTAPEFTQVGPHQISFEPPDILHLQLHGTIELEQFQVFHGSIDAIPPPTVVYVLRNARHGGILSSAARKYIAQNAKMERVAALVTYGSSFHGRTVLTMVSKALRLINEKATPAAFFETEAQAREWIAAHRRKSR